MITLRDMKILSIIPARGGSKGIPRKNILNIAGKPLIAYTIENAISSKFINRVIVSTDDIEIATISKRYGAEVIQRPENISGDKASSESALLHALGFLNTSENYEPDLLVFLQCTSPLTAPEDIDGTINTLIEQGADSSFSATSFDYFIWGLDNESNFIGINHNKTQRVLRQDKEGQYLETGAVYVMKLKGFLKAKHRFFGKTTFFLTPKERCFEIDEPIDFKVAEFLLSERNKFNRQRLLPKLIEAIALDFDGVFTDNRVIIYQDGSEGCVCNRSDGLGVSKLMETHYLPIKVFSTENNPLLQHRCSKLRIPFSYNLENKVSELEKWINGIKANPANVIFVGNDINDLECMKFVGCGVAVKDAYPEVINAARIVLESPGGDGAIREIMDLVKRRLEEENAKSC